MSDQSWKNSWGGPAKFFLAQTDRQQTIKVEVFFQWRSAFNNTAQNQLKNSCKPADFKQILQFTREFSSCLIGIFYQYDKK